MTKLPLWLWAFTSPKPYLKDPVRIAQALKQGKKVIILCNSEPVQIQYDGINVSIEPIKKYSIYW